MLDGMRALHAATEGPQHGSYGGQNPPNKSIHRDDLEKEEDQFVEHRIKLNECSMLRRVLGADKADVLPKVRVHSFVEWPGGWSGVAAVLCCAVLVGLGRLVVAHTHTLSIRAPKQLTNHQPTQPPIYPYIGRPARWCPPPRTRAS